MSYLSPATGHARPRAFPSSPGTSAWARRLLLIACALANASAFAAQVQARPARYDEWATITNKRFGFQIAYPSKILFPVETPSGTQDGRVLQSEDGKAKLLIATFENGEGLTLDAYRDFLLSGNYANTDIDYAPQKARWFVLSGVKGDQTFYERVTFSCGGRLINSWAMLYPTAQKKLYDPILEAVSRTYTAGAGADGNCGEAQVETPEAGEEKEQR
jgi:hypothetical protein